MNKPTRKILLVALIIQNLFTFFQEKKYGYYPNGERRVEVIYSNNLRKVKEYYKSGVLKDMNQLKNDTLIGKRKKYFENGKVKYFFGYSHDPIVNYINIKRVYDDL
jgi:antitoxin component YwqK of YwqJK toxin-antitoxin module